ncbi:uncharacterized protein LOC133188076 [Saccostrea echinata]|uniref:uncharacterized protein LOC133188076 n=1 Tax=Saccostrea echinata TaxID=191078 RepID=UPI002A80BEAC|nr:uncharacterized protein LOC133188076 [Saccostrea echinata]
MGTRRLRSGQGILTPSWNLMSPLLSGIRFDSAYDLTVCLDTALKFGFSSLACNFTEDNLKSWFTGPTNGFPCEEQCSLTVNTDPNTIYRLKRERFWLNNTIRRALNVNNRNGCQTENPAIDIEVRCILDEFEDYFGLLCSKDTDCWRANTLCVKYGKVGSCECRNGFVRIYGDCTAAAEKFKMVEETNTGIIAGVGFGCFVSGVVISLCIVVIYRQRNALRQHKDSNNAVDNRSYEKHIEITPSRQTPDMVSRLPPTIKEITYSNINGDSTSAKDDLYNHLNEEGKATTDLDDYMYDHANPVMEQIEPDEDYSHLTNENGPLQNTDHYFSLEKHKC